MDEKEKEIPQTAIEENKGESFETRLKEIEEILQMLETGSLPLEKSIQIYERGVSLIKSCNVILAEMEGKITLLAQDSAGNLQQTAFDSEE